MRRAIMLMASGLLLLATVAVVRANVTLLYFEAVPDDGQIVLEWVTATEYETAGFYVRRNTVPDFPANTLVSPYIPAEGESGQGAFYSFEDTTVTNGILYYYQLEEIMTNNTSNFVGVVSATAGLDIPTPTSTPVPAGIPQPPPTPTPTDTPVPGSTPGPTATLPGSTRTPTVSGQPTATPFPPGMVTLTATAAAPTASRQVTARPTATGQVVAPASPVVATVQVTLASGKQSVATSIARPAAQSSVQLSRIPALADKLSPTPVAKLAPGVSSSGAITVISSGTNWFVMGLVIGMFAVAILLVAGAVYLLRFLLR